MSSEVGMNTLTPKILTAAAGLTLLSAAYNATRPVAEPSVCAPPTWTTRDLDCGPGPRVLVIGGSVALGWGASDLAHTWWALACARVGGQWRNAAQPAARVDPQEIEQAIREDRWGADLVIELSGANDLVYGLAPLAGQPTKRVGRWLVSHAWLRGIVGPRLLTVIQPAPVGAPLWETGGVEDEARSAYAWMAMVGDVDLSALEVDYVDAVHFGDAGHARVADAIAGVVTEVIRAAKRREEG